MNILSLVSQNLDNFYQIQTKCYRNSDTVFFSPIHRTKRGPSGTGVPCTANLQGIFLSVHYDLKKVSQWPVMHTCMHEQCLHCCSGSQPIIARRMILVPSIMQHLQFIRRVGVPRPHNY
jgi:hypothetical protein